MRGSKPVFVGGRFAALRRAEGVCDGWSGRGRERKAGGGGGDGDEGADEVGAGAWEWRGLCAGDVEGGDEVCAGPRECGRDGGEVGEACSIQGGDERRGRDYGAGDVVADDIGPSAREGRLRCYVPLVADVGSVHTVDDDGG